MSAHFITLILVMSHPVKFWIEVVDLIGMMIDVAQRLIDLLSIVGG